MKTNEAMQTSQQTPNVIVSIAIGKLAKSPLNVRKKAPCGIAELADLIQSQGLIHNLVVTEQQKKKKKTGQYEVVAGGRRLAALQLLVAEGRLSDADEVNCRVVSMDEALAMSLAENSGREAMHPADLVMAYRNLTDAGLAPDEIAPRFGVSPLTVKRYLKLTNVSPAMFALYADDEMTFEQIAALALTDDHALQERVWNNTSDWQRDGSTFRRLITETEIDVKRNPLAKFVGVAAYEAAGGLIRRDLFKDADEGYMQDAELLESLVLELNQAVESIRQEGFAWIQVYSTFGYSDETGFGRVRTQSRQPTTAEQAQMNALGAELLAIEAEYESYDEDRDETGEVSAAMEAKTSDIQAKLDALIESFEESDADDLAIAGAVVTVDGSGQLRIKRGLIRKEDILTLPSGAAGANGDVRENEPKANHSEKLTRMLTAHRTAALQASMADRPDVALATIVHALAGSLFSEYGSSSCTPVKINLTRVYLKADAANIEDSKAALALAKKHQDWQDRIAAREDQDLFAWLLQQPQPDLLDLLALCVSYSIDTVSGRENVPSQPVAGLMNALNLNMAEWWEATAENYLSHVNKDRILEVVRETVSPDMAQTMTQFKKAELVEAAEKRLAGLKWLPDNLKVKVQAE